MTATINTAKPIVFFCHLCGTVVVLPSVSTPHICRPASPPSDLGRAA